jgi:tetratricopeptide (TPR) repeat protein
MYNYHEMEKRYDDYRKQTALRWIYPVSAISMALLAGSMFFALNVLNETKEEVNKSKDKNTTTVIASSKPAQKEQLELKLQEESPAQIAAPSVPPIPIPQPSKLTPKETVITPTAPASISSQLAKPGAVVIGIKGDETAAGLEARFAAKPDSAVAMKIAHECFAKHDYKNAADWAMKANEIESKNEESWILFARSLNRLGKKSDAIKALEGYLRQNDSSNARDWLNKIKNGSVSQ